MLRFIEHGYRVKMVETSLSTHAVWMTRSVKNLKLSDLESLYHVVVENPFLMRNGLDFIIIDTAPYLGLLTIYYMFNLYS